MVAEKRQEIPWGLLALGGLLLLGGKLLVDVFKDIADSLSSFGGLLDGGRTEEAKAKLQEGRSKVTEARRMLEAALQEAQAAGDTALAGQLQMALDQLDEADAALEDAERALDVGLWDRAKSLVLHAAALGGLAAAAYAAYRLWRGQGGPGGPTGGLQAPAPPTPTRAPAAPQQAAQWESAALQSPEVYVNVFTEEEAAAEAVRMAGVLAEREALIAQGWEFPPLQGFVFSTATALSSVADTGGVVAPKAGEPVLSPGTMVWNPITGGTDAVVDATLDTQRAPATFSEPMLEPWTPGLESIPLEEAMAIALLGVQVYDENAGSLIVPSDPYLGPVAVPVPMPPIEGLLAGAKAGQPGFSLGEFALAAGIGLAAAAALLGLTLTAPISVPVLATSAASLGIVLTSEELLSLQTESGYY